MSFKPPVRATSLWQPRETNAQTSPLVTHRVPGHTRAPSASMNAGRRAGPRGRPSPGPARPALPLPSPFPGGLSLQSIFSFVVDETPVLDRTQLHLDRPWGREWSPAAPREQTPGANGSWKGQGGVPRPPEPWVQPALPTPWLAPRFWTSGLHRGERINSMVGSHPVVVICRDGPGKPPR